MLHQATNHIAEVATHGTTFTLFSLLPPELRLIVWEQFARIPRIIKVSGNRERDWESKGANITIDGALREQACPLLAVNRESRYIALKDLLFFQMKHRAYAFRQWDVIFLCQQFDGFNDYDIQGDARKIANLMRGTRFCGHDKLMLGYDEQVRQFHHCTTKDITKLGNKYKLQNYYCLVGDSVEGVDIPPFQMDDIGELDTSRPIRYPGLLNWINHLKEAFKPGDSNLLYGRYWPWAVEKRQLLVVRRSAFYSDIIVTGPGQSMVWN
ncbi:hypothetical protein F4777DRAFT_547816 [Nemania sp. FL0916]|nr:hypothetical protein F4777DRAFT_547816 [Nemania sp. FL0916]